MPSCSQVRLAQDASWQASDSLAAIGCHGSPAAVHRCSMGACPTDEELGAYVEGRSQNAESIRVHLTECSACDELVLQAVRMMTADLSAEPAPMQPPQDARYAVEGVAGRGGMGMVFKARDTKLQRTVAMKLVRGRSTERLVEEAKKLAQLSHPNVVQVFDVVHRPGEEHVFLTMEYVEGGNLREWMDSREPDLSTRVRALLSAAEGLSAVHALGLVHGDVKPTNILVGHDGRVRIADFGLSARVGERTHGGTPRYMAPEQSQTGATQLADQFAFGITLLDCLAGPHVAWAATLPERTPMERSLRELAMRLVSHDPARRFPSMEQVAAELRRVLSGGSRRHLAAATVSLTLFSVLHLFQLLAMLYLVGDPEMNAPVDYADEVGEVGAFANGMYWIAFFNFLYCVVFAPIGTVLAPFSAYGLLRRRAWARYTSLLYASLALPWCITTPLALYLFYAMMRPGLRAELER